MKEALRNILPIYRISFWKVVLLACTILCWIAFHLPVFQNTASRLFFTYDLSYWQQFAEIGSLPAFFNHFFAQFQSSVLGIFITQGILAITYIACAYRIGGRYSLFMLPLWFVLVPSSRNVEQELALGTLAALLLLAILFHWISYRDAHRERSSFYYEVFYLKYWLYYVLAGCALFFCIGTPAILFLGTMVLYRLIILLTSLSSHGSENVENATLAFGIYLITAVGITCAFPRFLNVPECTFQWTWIEWSALGLFAAAIIGSLVQNALKRDLHNPYPLSWLFLAGSIAISAALAISHKSPLKTAYMNASNACFAGDYARMLEIGDEYLKEYPEPAPHATDAERGIRASISAYTRLALIMQGQLNSRFFEFRHVSEMQGMFSTLLPYTNSFDYAYARLYYETELYGSAIPLINYTLDHNGYEQRLFEILIPIEAATYQRNLLARQLPLLKKSIGNRNFARQWEKINAESIAMGIPDGPQPVGMGLKLSSSQTSINRLICQKVEHELFDANVQDDSWSNDRNTAIAKSINLNRPLNLPALEYYGMLCLLDGKIEMMPALARSYARMDAADLPRYIQEASLINLGLLEDADTASTWTEKAYMGFRFDPQIVARCLETARYLAENGNSPRADKLYGDTYTYYYLTKVNRRENAGAPHAQPYCPNI